MMRRYRRDDRIRRTREAGLIIAILVIAGSISVVAIMAAIENVANATG